MLLIRLLRILDLDKITQASFAEYHSKRNFVERVHASEDDALSRHGPFSASKRFDESGIEPGSEKHKMNMDAMADDVIACLKQVKFGGQQLEAFRGVKKSEFVYHDEERLKAFLQLSEEAKEDCEWEYKPVQCNPIGDEIRLIWKLETSLHGTYSDDYKLLTNTLTNATRTSWVDKYEATFYRRDEEWRGEKLQRKELQPIPDYIRWFNSSGELHYLSFERNNVMCSEWDDSPGLLRPDRMLDMLIAIDMDPPTSAFHAIASLVWLPEVDVKAYYKEQHCKIVAKMEDEKERECWKQHDLYSRDVPSLRDMCHKRGLSSKGNKHKLVERVASFDGTAKPQQDHTPYNGKIDTIPTSLVQLRNMSVYKLRYILNFHGLPVIGTKEQLCLRLFLLRQDHYHLAFKAEEDEIKRVISICSKIVLEERKCFILNKTDIRRKRTHLTYKAEKSHLAVPSHLKLDNLHKELFQPLKDYLSILQTQRQEKSKALYSNNSAVNSNTTAILADKGGDFFIIGKKVKIKWTKKEIGDSGWRCGWYTASIQSFSLEEDTLDVMYFSEENCIYTICVSDYLARGKLVAA